MKTSPTRKTPAAVFTNMHQASVSPYMIVVILFISEHLVTFQTQILLLQPATRMTDHLDRLRLDFSLHWIWILLHFQSGWEFSVGLIRWKCFTLQEERNLWKVYAQLIRTDPTIGYQVMCLLVDYTYAHHSLQKKCKMKGICQIPHYNCLNRPRASRSLTLRTTSILQIIYNPFPKKRPNF